MVSSTSTRIVSRAPARVCLFGDHQDYLGLPIIACAIDRYIDLTATPNNKKVFNIRMPDIKAVRKLPIDDPLDDLLPGDFLRTALKVCRRYGCKPTSGFDVFISGNVPVNAGLSSSTALTISWIQFLIRAFGAAQALSPLFLAQLAYETEVLEQGASGGKMDQYSIGFGQLIYLAPENDYMESFELSPGPLVVGVSGIAKDTEGLLAHLKNGALTAVEQVRHHIPDFQLSQAGTDSLDTLLPMVATAYQDYLRAAVGNHEITQAARKILQQHTPDLDKLAVLMNRHHALLRDYLKITVPRIDAMVTAALSAGANAAKIVGSGGGGCVVAMTDAHCEARVIAAIKAAGAVDAFSVLPAAGAQCLS